MQDCDTNAHDAKLADKQGRSKVNSFYNIFVNIEPQTNSETDGQMMHAVAAAADAAEACTGLDCGVGLPPTFYSPDPKGRK